MTVDDLAGKDREEIRRMLRERAREAYEAKEKEVTPEILRVVEQRYLLLPIIDRQWVDHLYVMDHLKTGIGLRGYGQKDPRVEYEKEAFEIFESLKNNIADEAIKGVFRVVIEHGPPPHELMPYRRRVRSSSRFRRASSCRSRSAPAATRSRRNRSSNFSARCPARAAAATTAHQQRRRRTRQADATRPTESRSQRTVPVRKRTKI